MMKTLSIIHLICKKIVRIYSTKKISQIEEEDKEKTMRKNLQKPPIIMNISQNIRNSSIEKWKKMRKVDMVNITGKKQNTG